MPIATTADHRAVADAVRAWAGRADLISAVRAQEASDPAAWRRHWDDVAGLGLLAVALPEDAGGAGGTVLDLAVMLEAAATALVPGPVLPTALAGLVLARGGASPELLARVAGGELPVAVALSRGSVTGERAADGGLVLHGCAPAVLGADEHTAVLLSARVDDGDSWVLLEPGTAKLEERAPTDFSRALADVHVDGVAVPASGVLATVDTHLDTDLVTDLAVVLAAAEASGVAAWCLRTAVDYATVREQFGRPIGSFQAVKHLCAEMLCRTEQVAAVAWDAAAAAGDDAQRPVAAAVAGAVALDAAVETAKDCIQVLGGIGFTFEHEAHLYLRRALVLRQLLGGSGRWRRRTAELTVTGTRRALRIELDEAAEARRPAVRETVAAIAALPEAERRAALVATGYLTPHWPAPTGLDADPALQLIVDQELARAGVVRPELVIAGWAVPTIVRYGTPEQVERFVRPSLLGELVWCQLFSEPGAGSDLAALRTRAERVEGGWRLSGQKVWTSLARTADWGICLARTNPDAPKHKGITYFLVDMRSPGLDIRPLREITGDALFNEVFLDDVFVPDDCVVGEVDGGWALARATLVNERLAMGGDSAIGAETEALVAAASSCGAVDDPVVLDRVGALVAQGVAGSLLDLRATLRRLDGGDAGAEASVRKLVGVRHRQQVAEAALDLLGPQGAVAGPELHSFLLTRCLSIAGGTTQVLLTLAGERLLGLPRG